MLLTSLLSTALLVMLAAAHPGHDHHQELAARHKFLLNHRNDLNHCAGKFEAEGIQQRSVERRSALAAALRAVPHLQGRQLSSIDRSHKSTKPFKPSTPPSEIFAGMNSCVLQPETTQGPFLRRRIDDGEPGVPLHLEIQIMDVDTCEPVKGVFLEIWSANATGVYSGANAIPNGSGLGDLRNLNNTFQRGLQQTDKDGVAQFDGIFHGHYTSRAVHIHFMVHLDATVFPNGTIWNNKTTHGPHRAELVSNADDEIVRQEAQTTDPFFEYVLVGDEVTDGILAWVRFGINTTFTRTIQAAAMRYEEGGQINRNNPAAAGFFSELFPGGFPTSFFPTPTGTGVSGLLPPWPPSG
ncbi:Intradiol ring-cleavage dioxygenase [Parachaetomium inaequale]|uniref:Intradiol ring-cleavage dioxygenase n=1 Tax=Parachaetomium inaequale TaxID=2588326 RepID=A0AAN6STN8_9PEZI|nr:Intradiol ring-cleavage dioxygenase [Parachaetomium inaequale]